MKKYTIFYNHPSVINAATWLRNHYNVKSHNDIGELFENEFNCRINTVGFFEHYSIDFPNESDAMLFVLKWS